MVATATPQNTARVGAGIEIHHLHHVFSLGRETVPVLENISLQLRPGESVALLGPSGCGKSTLLRLLAGLEPMQSGQIRIDNAAMGGPGPDRILVFQDPTLYPWLTVRQNVLLGPQAQGKKGREAQADALITRIGLQGFSQAWPRQLSGGMAQRAALARALLNEPRLLLLDEPLGKLDSLTRIGMQRELITLWQQQGYTSLLVTHDIEEALLLCERVLVMSPRPGRIIGEFTLPLAFPRHRDNPQLLQHRQDILRMLGQAEDW
ncbi:ABC transporter [Raoultella planticola]|jgi:NitT/TauT family transport system ATP-binding protein|uniref:ABC transporter ATP-binding protein n=1 Tax=Raoultella planticola TaxID=575 RepID=UPI0004E2956C|nr:ABC transporter ATP-binding protein [Raoultella planticola]AUV53258.1 ABC transporter [Raoultella planticola]EKW3525779.1 ABC transporter ATP-binding protein [Raoultella planticola]ELC3570861.1 ABC transporter ATP-binding protein [Raoultella planticola]ELF4967954.1 ABC transporter ATP-binding protein [Raoultella planticola]ELH7937636.1 ABC transporter ATP-binding protein [Raoultella planticola]